MQRFITLLIAILATLQWAARIAKSYWLKNGEELMLNAEIAVDAVAKGIRHFAFFSYELGADSRVVFERYWPSIQRKLVLLGIMMPATA